MPGERLEAGLERIDQSGKRDLFRHQFELAGFDLGNVQDVIDQVQQVIARRMDRLGKPHLFVAQVAFRILGQQPGQDQRTVQRRAQLVRHVGQKL